MKKIWNAWGKKKQKSKSQLFCVRGTSHAGVLAQRSSHIKRQLVGKVDRGSAS